MKLDRTPAMLAPAVAWTLRCSLALLLVTCALVRGGWSASPPVLSDDQRRRLAAGEVIVLEALPRSASPSAHGGTALAILRASPDRVWRILVDYPGHARFYPRVTGVEVLEADERYTLLRYEVGIGPFSFRFHMNTHPDPIRRRIEWELAEGRLNDLVRENTGYWQLAEAGSGTLVTYGLGVRTNLPRLVTSGSERASLVDTIKALRRLAEEGEGGHMR